MSSRKVGNGSQLPVRSKYASVRRILESCFRAQISPPIALLKLVFACGNPADLDSAMKSTLEAAAIRNSAALDELYALYLENRPACERVMNMPEPEPETSSMTPDAHIAWLRKSFDMWVTEDESLSVALYTFGNPRLIHNATQEIIDVLDEWGLLGPAVDVLQIGCGTGRVEALLAPRVRLAWGIDISANMINTARRKVAGLDNIRLSECSGRDLALFEAKSFDLVYAVDSFPYIVETGAELVDRHFAEVARVLRDDGHFVIFHYSYRNNPARDRRDVRRLAGIHGYTVVHEAVTPFTIWDGVGYHLRRSPRDASHSSIDVRKRRS
jgi:SAM-dependent methyltransferase